MNGSSSIVGNTALDGGGVFAASSHVTMKASSSIVGNTAGGIIFGPNPGWFHHSEDTTPVHDNEPYDVMIWVHVKT